MTSKRIKLPKSRVYSSVDYLAALRNKCFQDVELKTYEFDEYNLEGKLVLFDAVGKTYDYKPFQEGNTGKCAPFCATVNTVDGERVAFCGLLFDKNAIADCYKLITVDGMNDVMRLVNEPYYGSIPITSGICCLASEQIYQDYRDELIHSKIHPLDRYIHAPEELHLAIGNLAVFSTGWGEGNYFAYAAITEDGKICAICIDFRVLKPNKDDSEQIEIQVDIAEAVSAENKDIIANQTALINDESTNAIARFNAYMHRAAEYNSLGKFDKSMADYMSALDVGEKLESSPEISGRMWMLYDSTAQQLRAMNRPFDAIALYERAIAYGGIVNASAFINIIDIYLSEKIPNKALEAAFRMRKMRPNDANAYYKLAEIYVELMRYKDAADCYQTLIDVFKLKECAFECALCLLQCEQVDQANAVLENYRLSGGALNELYYYHVALVEYKRKNLLKAYRLAVSAYTINGEYLPILHLLIELDTYRMNFEFVTRWTSRYLDRRVNSEFGYSQRARAYFALNDYERAIDDYGKLIKLSDNYMYVGLEALCYIMLGDFNRAQKLIKSLKHKSPHYYQIALVTLYYARLGSHAPQIPPEKHKLFSNLYAGDDFFICLILIFIRIRAFSAAEAALQQMNLLALREPELLITAASLQLVLKTAKGNTNTIESDVRAYATNYLSNGVYDDSFIDELCVSVTNLAKV